MVDTSKGDWADKSINQPDIVAAQDSKYVKAFGEQWGVSNPHPGFGKDPNILNEMGHTKYPMLVYPEGTDKPGIIVNNQEEEDAALNKEPAELKQGGPTVEEFVTAGYKAEQYPPKGYASQSTEEEIKAAIEKQKKSTGW